MRFLKYKGHDFRVKPIKITIKSGGPYLDCVVGEGKYFSFELSGIEEMAGVAVDETLLLRPLSYLTIPNPTKNTLLIELDTKDHVLAMTLKPAV